MTWPVTDAETEDMDDVFSVGIASICWNYVVETLNAPFGFPPSQNIQVVVTVGSCTIPVGLKLLATE